MKFVPKFKKGQVGVRFVLVAFVSMSQLFAYTLRSLLFYIYLCVYVRVCTYMCACMCVRVHACVYLCGWMSSALSIVNLM